jgi:uncharacterized membrane protein
MTTELWATLIGAIVLLLTNLAAAIKLWGEVQKQKADRACTKEQRDKDSLELHDAVLKHSMQIQTLKDTQALHNTVMSDMQEAMNELNVNCAKLSVVVEQLTETVKELRTKT